MFSSWFQFCFLGMHKIFSWLVDNLPKFDSELAKTLSADMSSNSQKFCAVQSPQFMDILFLIPILFSELAQNIFMTCWKFTSILLRTSQNPFTGCVQWFSQFSHSLNATTCDVLFLIPILFSGLAQNICMTYWKFIKILLQLVKTPSPEMSSESPKKWF